MDEGAHLGVALLGEHLRVSVCLERSSLAISRDSARRGAGGSCRLRLGDRGRQVGDVLGGAVAVQELLAVGQGAVDAVLVAVDLDLALRGLRHGLYNPGAAPL